MGYDFLETSPIKPKTFTRIDLELLWRLFLCCFGALWRNNQFSFCQVFYKNVAKYCHLRARMVVTIAILTCSKLEGKIVEKLMHYHLALQFSFTKKLNCDLAVHANNLPLPLGYNIFSSCSSQLPLKNICRSARQTVTGEWLAKCVIAVVAGKW